VKAGATGNGSSWANTSGDLQAMINLSSEGDHIWVAAGTYIPNRQIDNLNTITPGNRNNAFVIFGNIQVYGGFAGHEAALGERNLKDNPTVLSGKAENINVYHVLIFMNGSEAILDGFTIEGGKADGKEAVAISGKEFRQEAGGGVYIMRSAPVLNDVIIKSNSAVYGGGIYSFHSFPVFTNVVVNHNSANRGGGVYNYYSFPTITNTTVSQNSGGGFHSAVSGSELSNSVVWGNGNDIYNDVYSRTDYSYSLVENETSDTDYLSIEDENPGEEETAGMYLYVSPDGNDANAGTKESPLATLAGARNKIREIKASARLPAGGITVYIRGGVYPVRETTYLTDEDSGTESSPVVYKAFREETPLFTGGFYIEGSRFGRVQDAVMHERLSPEARDKAVCFDLFANGLTFDDLDYSKEFWKQDDLTEHVSEGSGINDNFVRRMQVFIDDDALYPARYPNKTAGIFPENSYNTYLRFAEIYDGRGFPEGEDEEAWDGKAPAFRVGEPRIRNWRSHEDIIAFGMFGTYYGSERNLVKTIDAGAMTVELQSMPVYGLFDDGRVAFENVFEELDRPSEYYIDKNTGMLYLYPTKALKDATVKIALLDRNFIIDIKDASFVTFSGITFELTKGSVFCIRGGQHCAVENCNLKNFGIWGVRLGESALSPATMVEGWNAGRLDEYIESTPAAANGYDHRVSGCNFLNTGYHACRIASGSAVNRESGRMTFENNVIKYSGLFGSTYRSGLLVEGCGILIKNNSFFYCLGQAIQGNVIDTEVIQNEFCDSPCDMAEDTGTLYLNYLNANNGVKIRYNFFHDVTNMDNRFGFGGGQPHALRGDAGYDNNAPFKNFSYNVVYNYPSGGGGLSIAAPSTCIGNIFIDCDVVIHYQSEAYDERYKGKTVMGILTEEGQSTIATFYKSGLWRTPLWKEKYPELYEYFDYMENEKTDLMQPMDQAYNNLIVNLNKPLYTRNGTLEELQMQPLDPKYGKAENNHYLVHDPGFPSVTGRNFQLSEEVARSFGVDWIDMSRIGSSKARQTRSALPVTGAFVHNEAELREALNDGSVDAIIFANDITLSRPDLVIRPKRAKPDLVIDGNGHTLTEPTANGDGRSKAIRLDEKGAVRSITVHNMDIKGSSSVGTVSIETAAGVELTYRNVSYKGPKLAENITGSILVDNCNVHISPAESGGTYAGEAVRANRIRFTGRVNVQKDYDADGTMEAIIRLAGREPSLIIEESYELTIVDLKYEGKEVEEDQYIGGGGAIDAEYPFDLIIENNASLSFEGIYEYLTGAKPARITGNWSSSIRIIIHEDIQRGTSDKILSVAGDVTLGSASSIDMDVLAPAQCLLEIGGHFHMYPGSILYLNGDRYDPDIPGQEVPKYPVLLMKGGANSTVVFDRPGELFINSQRSPQEWMRSIGFLEDGVIRFTAHQFSFKGRDPDGEETVYETESNGLLTVEAQVKGGMDGVTRSLSYHTEDGSPLKGGATLDAASVNLKDVTRFFLASDRERLGISSDDYRFWTDVLTEPETARPPVGNLPAGADPLFRDAPAGDFSLQAESPLIDAGNNQSYLDIINLYLPESQKYIAGSRIIGGTIDIGAYEYNPLESGNTLPVDLPDGITAWTQLGQLHIRSETPAGISIYTVSGILAGKLTLKAYETATLHLYRGIYILVPDSGRSRKVIVR
jgi:hypothetical protein